MIIYSIGKRIKNFIKVVIFPKGKLSGSKKNGGKTGDPESTVKNGIIRWYYDDGKLRAELSYKNGILEGISNYYYGNGNLKARENYLNGKLEGLTKKYNEKGEVITEEYYKKGNLLFKRVLNLNGDITLERNF